MADFGEGGSRKLVTEIMTLRTFIWRRANERGFFCRIIVMGIEHRYKGACTKNHWRCGHPHNNPQCREETLYLPNGKRFNAMRKEVNNKIKRILDTEARRKKREKGEAADFFPVGNTKMKQ